MESSHEGGKLVKDGGNAKEAERDINLPLFNGLGFHFESLGPWPRNQKVS
jgi:hypothetical protein